ncbi:hypothetical protein LWI28_022658 [Acer negundo]|uniref:Uncharacterized protein n=1 Tax=Acer negundo TaxID=4023 RepID=A0AAD5NG23_ACENE|nr:hypothetical protein LWI28_022658 [Acer negundo]
MENHQEMDPDDNNSLDKEGQFVNVNEIHDRAFDCEGDRETSKMENADSESVVQKAETVVATFVEKANGVSVVEKVKTTVKTDGKNDVEKADGKSVIKKDDDESVVEGEAVVQKAEGDGERVGDGE